ncbi:hypothetical protein [Planctomycetes bacterium K23_9]|uniref:hypothetical protein n=1 Tax=Stieleria marina TaxID=1930275 RepID=UPI0011A997EF
MNFRKDGQAGSLRIVRIGGQPGVAIFNDHQPVSVVTLAIRGNAVTEVYVMRNPDKQKLWPETVT